MNFWGGLAAIVLTICGYLLGWQQGHDRAVAGGAKPRPLPAPIVVDYPFTEVCSTMLEAAWSIETVTPAADVQLDRLSCETPEGWPDSPEASEAWRAMCEPPPRY